MSPALKVTTSPALIFSSDLPVSVPEPSFPAVAIQAALFTAFTTVSTVANLFPSPVLGAAFPSLPVLIVPVLAFSFPSVVLPIVSPSVFTEIPLAFDVIEPSAALISNFTFAPLGVVTVLPFFTSSCFVTVTVVPLPFTKFTWSSVPIPATLVLGSPAIFQPVANFLEIEFN